MTSWKIYKLSEVANISTGFPFAGEKYAKEGIRVVRGDNVTIGALRWDYDKLKCWNEPFARADEFSLMSGDIVVGMDGSRVGLNRAQVKETDLPLLLAQRVACIRHNEKTTQDFLYYQIFSERFVKYIKQVQTGTSIPHVSLKQIGGFEISLPSLEEQRRIAGILSAIDDKIENNRRINDNLEQQVQSLYKQWFVDFDFPNEEGKPYKSSGGKMVDSELGLIPEGWRTQTFGDLIKPQKGKNITRAQVTTGSVPVVAGGLMPSCYHNTSNTHCPVVTISASGANAGYVKMYHTPIWAADCSFIDDTISKYVYFAYVFLTYNQTSIYHKQQGCAQPHIYPSHLMELQFICPTLNILDIFESWCSNIYRQVGVNIQENETLATLRDTLLPKLMSGEIKL